MGINKNVQFNDSELLNEEADDLCWSIKGIDGEINAFIEKKNRKRETPQKT